MQHMSPRHASHDTCRGGPSTHQSDEPWPARPDAMAAHLCSQAQPQAPHGGTRRLKASHCQCRWSHAAEHATLADGCPRGLSCGSRRRVHPLQSRRGCRGQREHHRCASLHAPNTRMQHAYPCSMPTDVYMHGRVQHGAREHMRSYW